MAHQHPSRNRHDWLKLTRARWSERGSTPSNLRKPSSQGPLVRFGSWLGLLAVLLLTICPTLAQAFQRSPDRVAPVYADICTASGGHLVTLGDLPTGHNTSAPLPEIGNPDHCPLCGVTGHSGMPESPTAPLKLPALSDAPPRLFLLAPRLLFAWLQARPRGPPQDS
jgi:hypothetical protein